VSSPIEGRRKLVLIKIKPLRPSLKFKFNEIHSKEVKSINLIEVQVNGPTLKYKLEILSEKLFICLLVTIIQRLYPYIQYQYKNSICSSISCLIYFRLEICVCKFGMPGSTSLPLISFSKWPCSKLFYRRYGFQERHSSIFKEGEYHIYIWRIHKG